MTDADGSMDDIEPADVVSEELLILLNKQNKLITKLLEQQQTIHEELVFGGGTGTGVDESEIEQPPEPAPECGFY